MRLHLPNSDLATNDAKNVSVMGPHLAHVYQAHRPVDFTILAGILQRLMIPELDAPITWEELFKFFNSYWNEETDFSEWHEGQVVPVPKS